MLKPVGFWSYSRQDDKHSGGQLTQLRLIVGNAINLRLGEEVMLFQDTEAIPFGTDWAAKIEQSIEDVTFFIPVVTPAFLRSAHCRDEFRAFRRRMTALRRDDLIFPIHYVDVDRFDPTESVLEDDLAALHRSNWADFRPLYFEELNSPKVKQWADRLAASILSAMRRAAVTRKETPQTERVSEEKLPTEPTSGVEAAKPASSETLPSAKPPEPIAATAPGAPFDSPALPNERSELTITVTKDFSGYVHPDGFRLRDTSASSIGDGGGPDTKVDRHIPQVHWPQLELNLRTVTAKIGIAVIIYFIINYLFFRTIEPPFFSYYFIPIGIPTILLSILKVHDISQLIWLFVLSVAIFFLFQLMFWTYYDVITGKNLYSPLETAVGWFLTDPRMLATLLVPVVTSALITAAYEKIRMLR